MTLPNGVTSNFGYDNAERLTGITHQGLTQTLGSYAYALDAVGNRLAVTETLLVPGAGISTTTINYGYDALYQLTSANYTTRAVFRHTYDAVGQPPDADHAYHADQHHSLDLRPSRAPGEHGWTDHYPTKTKPETP